MAIIVSISAVSAILILTETNFRFSFCGIFSVLSNVIGGFVFNLQTVVCFPFLGGVIELGATEVVSIRILRDVLDRSKVLNIGRCFTYRPICIGIWDFQYRYLSIYQPILSEYCRYLAVLLIG